MNNIVGLFSCQIGWITVQFYHRNLSVTPYFTDLPEKKEFKVLPFQRKKNPFSFCCIRSIRCLPTTYPVPGGVGDGLAWLWINQRKTDATQTNATHEGKNKFPSYLHRQALLNNITICGPISMVQLSSSKNIKLKIRQKEMKRKTHTHHLLDIHDPSPPCHQRRLPSASPS
jgi:hypothetical protein